MPSLANSLSGEHTQRPNRISLRVRIGARSPLEGKRLRQDLSAYKWRIDRLVNPPAYRLLSSSRNSATVRGHSGIARRFPSYVPSLGGLLSLPANALGRTRKGSRFTSLRHLLVASARSVVVKSAGLLSVSSLNPAGTSFVFVRLFAADNTSFSI